MEEVGVSAVNANIMRLFFKQPHYKITFFENKKGKEQDMSDTQEVQLKSLLGKVSSAMKAIKPIREFLKEKFALGFQCLMVLDNHKRILFPE
jgi:hypothetical protein